jgi:phosphomannomutase/phosphoglucomutase
MNNCQLAGDFPIGTPDPTEEKIAKRLAKEVLESGSDLGFSYDSDGDRIGVVDEKGNILWNDVLVVLFAKAALEVDSKANVVYNALCSKAIQDIVPDGASAQFLMWQTGHSFIKAKAQQENAFFAGELSGHFYFLGDFYPHDDGCYSTLALLSYLSKSGKTLSQIVEKFPKYISSPEIKVACPDEVKVGLMVKISEKLRNEFPEAKVIDDDRVGDGVRVEFPDKMFVIRYSQNAPYLTIKFEARDIDAYDRLKAYINNLLHAYQEVDWSSEINVNLDSLNIAPENIRKA